ncbi:MAG TPA: histidine kinase, partial [Candidatus Limnocylindrales bacterium]|nr:histidine kinase [Candidatus Limnocylindrales bacterium]
MRDVVRDHSWALTIAAGGTAMLLAVAILFLRLTGPTELAVIPTQTWPWASHGVGVEPTAVGSRFRVGDVVVAMDGTPMETWVESAIRPPWEAHPAPLGNTVRFDVVRDGSMVSFDVPLTGFPVARLGGVPLGLAAFGASVLVLGVVLMLRRPRSTVLRLLFLAGAANLADVVAWEVGLQPTDFGLPGPMILAFAAASLFNVVFWSTIVHILAIYPVRSPLVARQPGLVAWFYAAPLVALLGLAAIAYLAGGTALDRVDRLAAVMGLVGSGMLVAILAATVAGYRRTAGIRRRQVRWIALTLSFAAVATLALLTLPIVLTGEPLVARSTVSFLVLPVPIAVAIAVVRDRIFQVGLLSRSREQIVAAREEERLRLRRELHDGLAPTLAGVGIKLDLALQSARDDPEYAAALVEEARTGVRAAVTDIRRMARDLRPPALDALGLEGALREQAAGLASQAGDAPVIIVDVPAPLPNLPPAVEVAAYRIAVEALLNVVRHAAASHCEVRLAIGDDQLEVDIIDDGRGLEGGSTGVGTR